jgi:dihydrodipicolinate synthase/N-acetylneuraminate lyase
MDGLGGLGGFTFRVTGDNVTMTFHELAQPLRGIIVPMVTPLAGPDELDEPGLERLVEHLVTGGVHGLFLLGTCGEGPSVSHRLRRQLVERVCSQVDGRLPVLVGITDTSYAESLDLAGYAADAGADAVVLAPPYYYPIDQSELLGYVQRLARRVPVPMLLYNMPSLTKVSFEPQTVRRLMEEKAIVGVKDSSGDLDYFANVRAVTRQRSDWTLLMGPEHLLAESIKLGGDGGISGGANVWPQLFVQIYDAATAGQDDEVTRLVAQANCLGRIYQTGRVPASSVIKGLKTALSVLGICNGVVAEPFGHPSPEAVRQIESIVRSLAIEPPVGVDALRPTSTR